MILFDLACRGCGHVFEAWFKCSDGYASQQASGLVMCPLCGGSGVDKAAMAPRLTAKGNQRGDAVLAGSPPPTDKTTMVTNSAYPSAPATAMRALVAALARQQAAMLPQSTWVGDSFVQQARAMHDGTADAALIHGTASPDEAQALRDDGVAVVPLLVPIVPPEAAN